ncbi:hypothetical protein [Bacillus cereus]|uniref:hypothetical protein n=1 Tax=Bacillus cereus TaxID=1396 RepID=UPI000BEB841C|nr:hypothetical protein [Bacillus cereus]PEF63493.1 hypothetical protein CON35_18095 [Bacillus cereus]
MYLNQNSQQYNKTNKYVLDSYHKFVTGMVMVAAGYSEHGSEREAERSIVEKAFENVAGFYLNCDFDEEVMECVAILEDLGFKKPLLSINLASNIKLLEIGLGMMEKALLSYKKHRGENGEFAIKEINGALSDDYMMNIIGPFCKWKENMLNHINKQQIIGLTSL